MKILSIQHIRKHDTVCSQRIRQNKNRSNNDNKCADVNMTYNAYLCH